MDPLVFFFIWLLTYSIQSPNKRTHVGFAVAAAIGTVSKGAQANARTIRKYEFNITRGFISPDGFNKSALLVNGVFPGPPVEANYGDTIQVVVNNYIKDPEEGTTFHWHGILQTNTPWYDGVAAVTQCPIAPGKSMTYTFVADSYGTSFYHAHYSSQYIDGLFGPIVISGPPSAPYDIDLGPVILTDYFHAPYYENLALVEAVPAQVPFSDNNLINGKNYQNCTSNGSTDTCSPVSRPSVFHFEPGKVHRLRLINAGAEGLQRFSIDHHTLQVIAYDFVPIIPYQTNVLTLGVGQRADVLVHAQGPATSAVWMRSDISSLCAATRHPHALAIIYYPEADRNSFPSSTGHKISDASCTNDPLSSSIPWKSQRLPSISSTTILNTTVGVNSTGHTLFYINNSSFKGNFNHPILLELADPARSSALLSSPPKDENIYNFGNSHAIRITIINPDPPSHPMHLHGHEFFILAEGFGVWDGKIVNAHNPARKDTHMLPGGTPDMPAFLVIEIIADNPGVWAFHCHIAWSVNTNFISQ